MQNNYIIGIVTGLSILISGCRDENPNISKEDYSETQEQLVEVNKILVRKDRLIILGYIERNQLEMQESATGLWYSIIEKGSGTSSEEGRLATINFRIGLLDGTECYSSLIQGPKSFRIGRGGVESGLEEGIRMLNAGGKAKFIMPPHLAHGLPGDGNKIPARAIIVFDVEVVSVE